MKTTLKFHLTPVRMPKISGRTYKRCGACRGKGPAFTVGRSQTSVATVEISMENSQKTKNKSGTSPTYFIPWHMSKGLNTLFHRR